MNQIVPLSGFTPREKYRQYEEEIAHKILGALWSIPEFQGTRETLRKAREAGPNPAGTVELFQVWSWALRVADPNGSLGISGDGGQEILASDEPRVVQFATSIRPEILGCLNRIGLAHPTERHVFYAASFLLWPGKSKDEAWTAYAPIAGWAVEVPDLKWSTEPELPMKVRKREYADYSGAFEEQNRPSSPFKQKFNLQGRKPLEEDKWSGWRELVEKGEAVKKESPWLSYDQIGASHLGLAPATYKKWRRRYRETIAPQN